MTCGAGAVDDKDLTVSSAQVMPVRLYALPYRHHEITVRWSLNDIPRLKGHFLIQASSF